MFPLSLMSRVESFIKDACCTTISRKAPPRGRIGGLSQIQQEDTTHDDSVVESHLACSDAILDVVLLYDVGPGSLADSR